ncbi:MAG: M20/M25/M40 family metallo-hydrolase [Bdellovibrionales bacterium]|nr:M20/M25/M40 family metallo-hydrolase [Bdellovibrionales bacterium]
MDFIQACREFIAIDSTPSQGSYKAAEFAAKFCENLGLTVERQVESSAHGEEMNLIVRPTSFRDGFEFLLQNHLDTVDPGPFHSWNKTELNPFYASIIDNNIYGLGAADVKLDFLVKAKVLSEFVNHPNFKLPPVLVATFGEETGMQGALKLIRKNKINPKYALIGEPTNLTVANAGKGFVSVEIQIPFSESEIQYRSEHNLRESTSTQSKVFHGKSAHSSTPHLGDSAIIKMLDYLQHLPDSVAIMEIDGGNNYNTVPSHAFLELDLTPIMNPINSKITTIYKAIKDLENEFKKIQDSSFSPSYPTLNIGLIRTFQDHILISGSGRILPTITQEVFDKWMHFLKSSCESCDSLFRVTDYKKPFKTETSSVFLKGACDTLKELDLDNQPKSLSSTNEISLFNRVGVECLGFGPGLRDGNIHTPNEHVSIKDLEVAQIFYRKMIERFCL